MERTRKPGGGKIVPKQHEYPAGRFGEEGYPGYMLAPLDDVCPARKANFPIGECVDLAICGFFCEVQCEKYLMFGKNARVKVRRDKDK